MSNESGKQEPTFWVTGWLGNGVKVSFTVPTSYEGAYEDALGFTNRLLALGFRHTELGTEPGEMRETIGYICRRVSIKDDDSETPLIDLYATNDAIKYKVLSVYLNTPEDVAAFEAAAGVKLNSLQLYASKLAPERGDKLAGKFIAKVRPFAVIFKDNPNYKEGGTKPKHKFVRWDTVTAPAALPGEPVRQQSTPQPEPPLEVVSKTFTVYAVQTRQKDDDTLFYQLATGSEYVYAFGRDVFRAVGYADDVTDKWKKPGFSLKLQESFEVKAEQRTGKNGKAYWHALPPELPPELQATGTDVKF